MLHYSLDDSCYIWVHKINNIMNEQAVAMHPDERVHKHVDEVMNIYNSLSTDDQVPFFNMLKENIIKHRSGMINDCKSDLEANEYRLKMLSVGLEEIQHGYGQLKEQIKY